jgi:outer membrane protein OmpA-like peptidoglycan-associated protein
MIEKNLPSLRAETPAAPAEPYPRSRMPPLRRRPIAPEGRLWETAEMASRSACIVLVRIAVCAAPINLALAPTAAPACMPLSVEFAYGSARLDAAGRESVTYALEEFQSLGDARVRLVAQTDGSAGNARMSLRRAQAIRAALVRRGVPARAIAIETPGPEGTRISGQGYARLVVILVDPVRPPATTGGGSC